MPVIYKIESELECAQCLHTFEPEEHPHAEVRVTFNHINSDQEFDNMWIECPKCKDVNLYSTIEIEIPYGDEYL